MQGMSEREYAARVGLSRGAIQKAKAAGRLVLHADGSIDPAASDARRAAMTDPSKSRARPVPPRMKPVPDTAVAAVGETLREHGMAPPSSGTGTTFLQAKTSNEVLKSHERRLRLSRMKGELVDRARAEALVFRLARQERDAWVNWPRPRRRAPDGDRRLGLEASTMQKVLEFHVRAHLDELAEVRLDLR